MVDYHSRLTSLQGKGEMFTWWLIKAEESSCEKTTFSDEYGTNKLTGNQNGTGKLTRIQNKAVHMDTATEQCILNSGNNKEPSDLETLPQ